VEFFSTFQFRESYREMEWKLSSLLTVRRDQIKIRIITASSCLFSSLTLLLCSPPSRSRVNRRENVERKMEKEIEIQGRE
jgi:hypothetical protein